MPRAGQQPRHEAWEAWEGKEVPGEAGTSKCIHNTLNSGLLIMAPGRKVPEWGDDPAEINPGSVCLVNSDSSGETFLA